MPPVSGILTLPIFSTMPSRPSIIDIVAPMPFETMSMFWTSKKFR